MGRRALSKNRKPLTKKVKAWLADLLLKLQSEDLEQLTMDDIAFLAKKSKSTIYVYFDSKEEILLAASKTRLEGSTKTIAHVLTEDLDTLQLYRSLVHIFIEATVGISISYLQSIKKNYPVIWQVIEETTDYFLHLLSKQYKKGMEEGIFNEVSVELASHLDKIFVMQVVTNPDFFNDDSYTTSDLIKDYLNLRLTGLLKR